MPPTLYIPVAPPSPLPALTAETEIQLFPSPISVLDTEFIPPMDRPSSRKSLRSRASVPRAQSPSQSNLDNAPSYKRSPSVFSDDGMSSLTSFHSDSEDSGDIANHSDEDEGTHDFSMPKVAAREMSIFSFFGAGETEGDEQEASVYRVVDPDKSKIPAPTGGAGRPGSGGYSLREQLGWDADQLNNLRVRPLFFFSFFASLSNIQILAARLVEDLLDETKSITHQDSRNMIRARHEVFFCLHHGMYRRF